MIRRIIIALLTFVAVAAAGLGVATYIKLEDPWHWNTDTISLTVVPRRHGNSINAAVTWVIDTFRVQAERGAIRTSFSMTTESSIRQRLASYKLGPVDMGWGHTGVQFRVPDPPPEWAQSDVGHRSTLYVHSYYWFRAPFWMLTAAFGLYPLTALVLRIRRKRRIRRRKLCKNCQYELTGNDSGVCPECGHEITPPENAQPQPTGPAPLTADP